MDHYIHLIRHGITEGNLKHWYYGAADIPLSEEGRSKLRKLREKGIYPFADPVIPDKPAAQASTTVPEGTIVKYFTSGMLRTEETFRLIYDDRPHSVEHGLKEMDFGDFECMTHEELSLLPEFNEWMADTTGFSNPYNGEAREPFRRRVRAAFRRLMMRQPEEPALQEAPDISVHYIAICHGGPIAVIMASLFRGERDQVFEWIPDPGRGYTVRIKDLSVRSHTDI